jgi:hypothetical protein
LGLKIVLFDNDRRPDGIDKFSRIGEYVRNTHNDLGIAKRGKLPTLIVQGQQEYGAAAELMVRVFGASWFTNGWLKMKFINTLQVFDPVSFSGVVANVTEKPDVTRFVEPEVWARRASDEKLTAVGWASCKLSD